MPIIISKWGNSAGIRLPATILSLADMQLGDEVLVTVNPDKSLTLRTARPKRDLDALLAQITPENTPDFSEFDTSPVGSEVW